MTGWGDVDTIEDWGATYELEVSLTKDEERMDEILPKTKMWFGIKMIT